MRTADPAREPRIVADQRRRAGLPADRLLLDHERGQPLGGRVDGRRQSAGTGSDHHDVVDAVGGEGRHQAERVRDLEVGGRLEGRRRRGERQLHDGQLGIGQAEAGEQPGRRLRADLVEAHRDVVAAERVTQGVGALVTLLADDPHRLEADPLGQVPVVQGVDDRSVELLVASALGAQEHQLGVPLADGREHVRRAGEVAPDRADGPFGGGVQRVGAAQEVEALAVVGSEAGNDQRDLPLPPLQPLEDGPRVGVVRTDDHLVVASVAPSQLRADHVA